MDSAFRFRERARVEAVGGKDGPFDRDPPLGRRLLVLDGQVGRRDDVGPGDLPDPGRRQAP